MIVVVNNSNRNREILSNLRKSKRMMENSKKCLLKKSKKNNQTRTVFVTDKLIDYLKKNKIPYKDVTSSRQMKKLLESKEKVSGIILGGSNLKYSNKLCACSINNNIISLLEFNVPILGICFGFQIMAASYGGEIKSMKIEDNGIYKVKKIKESKLLNGLNNSFNVYQSHRRCHETNFQF